MPGERACLPRAELSGAVDRRTTIVIFLVALAFCAALTKSHVTSWSDQSRVATVDALTSRGTFVITGSPYAQNLGDEITFRGRTYSDKPPLLSLLATAVVLAAAPFGVSLQHTPATAIYLMTLLTVGVWFAIGCAYAYAFARMLGFERRIAAAVAALTGVATLTLPYAIVLTNHVPCGAAGLAGCYHLVRARDGRAVHAALAGLFFALAYAFDAAGILLAVAGAVLLWGQPARRWLIAVAAGLPVVALQMAYNVHVSGSVLPTAFTGSVWTTAPIPPGATEPQPFALHSAADYAQSVLHVLVGGKGLLSYTPLVLVAAYGLAVMWRTGGVMRRLATAIVAATVLFVVTIVTLADPRRASAELRRAALRRSVLHPMRRAGAGARVRAKPARRRSGARVHRALGRDRGARYRRAVRRRARRVGVLVRECRVRRAVPALAGSGRGRRAAAARRGRVRRAARAVPGG